MSAPFEHAALVRTARHRGVAPDYTDADGRRRQAGDDTLAAILALLGEATPDAGLPPVIVAWDGALAPLDGSRLRRRHGGRAPLLELRGEDGGDLGPLAPTRSRAEELAAAGTLPYGVHELLADGSHVAHVVAAPSRADGRRPGEAERPWGVFAPVHAIRDGRDRPAGDLTSLERLGDVIGGLGGSAVATLPLLAEPATADGGGPRQQPYSPLSRMFWNEAYLDLARVPELARDDAATRRLLAAAWAGGGGRSLGPRRTPAGAARAAGAATAAGLADLASLASAARPALDAAVRRLHRAGGGRLGAFHAYRAAHPELARYARFRAATEQAGVDLASWPAAWRAGRIGAGEVPATAVRRHCFAQWAMDEQLAEISAALGAAGVGLVMDLPIGCSATGYDPWAFPGTYVEGASLGAPPDSFFTAGQNWGFPPPHPDVDRRAGYRVLRACLAHSLRHASVLRVDHVLGWSRLWWVPNGAPADEGAYVSYRLDELVAVASLEAWRHSARLVGEDLGTVQRGLRSKLRGHGIAGMQVAVFGLGTPARRLRPPAGAVAYVDTHDTATFAGWFSGSDIAERRRLGLLADDKASAEEAARAEARDATLRRLVRARALPAGAPVDAVDVLGALLAELGASAADLVLVALEDLWAEQEPQNVPGTTTERDNFSRRFALTLEELAAEPRALAVLAKLDTARRSGPRRK